MLSGDITFEDIVEKVKIMLGENYKGDTETVPAYSELFPLEGYTDSFGVISNGGFTEEDIQLIQEKTKHYAWWVANHGYLVDSTQKEIKALIIYGSEVGEGVPDVLSFIGATENGFYLPMNKTDLAGTTGDTEGHLYIRYASTEDTTTMEYETTVTELSNELEINGVTYKLYIGRLYPEDKVILDKNVVYPIYLISNLDYYYMSEEGDVKALNGAHTTELVEKNSLEVLQCVCGMVIYEAAQWTNRIVNTSLLNDCWSVIVKCACMAYLNRGAEGISSQSELGQQNVYQDWVKLMHQQLTNRRYIL